MAQAYIDAAFLGNDTAQQGLVAPDGHTVVKNKQNMYYVIVGVRYDVPMQSKGVLSLGYSPEPPDVELVRALCKALEFSKGWKKLNSELRKKKHRRK